MCNKKECFAVAIIGVMVISTFVGPAPAANQDAGHSPKDDSGQIEAPQAQQNENEHLSGAGGQLETPSFQGAIRLKFGAPVDVKAQSRTLTLGEGGHRAVFIPAATFVRDEQLRVTATLHTALLSHRPTDYWIHAAIFDQQGRLLGTGAHKVASSPGAGSLISIGYNDIDLDFGSSQAYRRAALAVIVVSDPSVP